MKQPPPEFIPVVTRDEHRKRLATSAGYAAGYEGLPAETKEFRGQELEWWLEGHRRAQAAIGR